MTTATLCPDCDHEHLGPPCGMSFGERMRTVKVSPSVFETRRRRAYYDREQVEAMFGEDSREQFLEETKGLGAARRQRDGSYRSDETKERIDPEVLDQVYEGAATEREYDPATDDWDAIDRAKAAGAQSDPGAETIEFPA